MTGHRVVNELQTCQTCGVLVADGPPALIEALSAGRALVLAQASAEPHPYGATNRVFCSREHLLVWLAHPSSAPPVRERPAGQGRAPLRLVVPEQAPPPDLTERQLQVLRCGAEHKTVQETAAQLYLSRDTVKTYRRQVLSKFGASTIAQAVDRARQAGVLT